MKAEKLSGAFGVLYIYKLKCFEIVQTDGIRGWTVPLDIMKLFFRTIYFANLLLPLIV